MNDSGVGQPDPVTTTWLLLVALTVASFGVIEGNLLSSISALIVIALAGYKAWLIMLHFMETKSAPRTWRLMYTSWIVVVVTIIVVGNYVAVFSCGADCAENSQLLWRK